MGLMDMNRGFKKYAPWVVAPLCILMLGGVVFNGFGSALGDGSGGGSAPAGQPGGPEDPVVATVGSVKVTRSELDRQLEQVARGGQLSPLMQDQFRYMILDRSYKQKAALEAAAKAAGVTVADADLGREREKAWATQRPQIASMLALPPTATDADIQSALQKQQPGLTTDALKSRIPDDDIRASLYQQGLVNSFKKQVTVNEGTVRHGYDEIQVRHILVKSGEGGLPDAQAKAKAEKILGEVKANPAKMADLAKQFTDDPGSKATGGFYDWSPASKYVPEFTKAARDAGVGKVNPELAKTSFGYHIIKLEGQRPGKDFPKDWDKSKQKYIDEAVEREAQQKVMAAVTAQAANIKVEIQDPGIRAAQLEEEARATPDIKARDAKLEQALAELGKVKPADDRGGTIPLRRAAILSQLNRNKDAIAAYEDALKLRSNSVDTRISLAELYLKEKDRAGATRQLDEAMKLPVPDPTLMMRIGLLYQQAGDATKSKVAMDKFAELQKRMQQIQELESKAAAQTARPVPGPPPGGTAPATATTTTTATTRGASPAPAGSAAPPPSPATATK
jgi:parvulin-like peptidyl-prolyl isomerase